MIVLWPEMGAIRTFRASRLPHRWACERRRLLMRSVLRAGLGVALATLLLASTTACGSPASRTAGASASAASTTRGVGSPGIGTPQPKTIPARLDLGCGPKVHPASYVIDSGPARTAKKYVALTFDDGPSPDYTH